MTWRNLSILQTRREKWITNSGGTGTGQLCSRCLCLDGAATSSKWALEVFNTYEWDSSQLALEHVYTLQMTGLGDQGGQGSDYREEEITKKGIWGTYKWEKCYPLEVTWWKRQARSLPSWIRELRRRCQNKEGKTIYGWSHTSQNLPLFPSILTHVFFLDPILW